MQAAVEDVVPVYVPAAGREAFDGAWQSTACKGCPHLSLYTLDMGKEFQAFVYAASKRGEQYCAWAIGTRAGTHLALKLHTDRACAQLRGQKDATFEADLVNGELRATFSKPGTPALTFTRVQERPLDEPAGSVHPSAFNVDSLNIGCLYTPRGGSSVYVPMKFGPELSCDRTAPTYVRAYLGRNGPAELLKNPNEQSCCTLQPSLKEGDHWERGPFRCEVRGAALTCKRHGGEGFVLSATQMEGVRAEAQATGPLDGSWSTQCARCDHLGLELVEQDGQVSGTAIATTDTPGVSRGRVVGTRKGDHVELTLHLEQINPHVSFRDGWVFTADLVDGELREAGQLPGQGVVLTRKE